MREPSIRILLPLDYRHASLTPALLSILFSIFMRPGAIYFLMLWWWRYASLSPDIAFHFEHIYAFDGFCGCAAHDAGIFFASTYMMMLFIYAILNYFVIHDDDLLLKKTHVQYDERISYASLLAFDAHESYSRKYLCASFAAPLFQAIKYAYFNMPPFILPLCWFYDDDITSIFRCQNTTFIDEHIACQTCQMPLLIPATAI